MKLAFLLAFITSVSIIAQDKPSDQRALEIFKQLIEINTTDSVGNVTTAANAVADRLKAAGFPAADVQVLGPDPRKFNLVARYHGTGARRPLLLLAHLDVVEAKREDWSFDPFVFLEDDGFFYGRGTSDDKAMASILVANLTRLKQDGFRPARDLINALPQLASANVNCRILPGEAPGAVKQKLIDVLADPKITVAFVDEAKPSPPSPLQPQLMQPLESITNAIFPGAIVVPTMGTGATDGLYLRNAGIPTYGIEGIFYEMDDNRAHGRDERVGAKQYFEGLEFQYRLIKALASSRP